MLLARGANQVREGLLHDRPLPANAAGYRYVQRAWKTS